MNRSKVKKSSLTFLAAAFAGMDPSGIHSRCDELEDGFTNKEDTLKEIVETAISSLDYVKPEDFIPKTHRPTIIDESKINVIGSQTHGVVCINYNLHTKSGKIDTEKIDTSFTLGGDPMMTMFLLNLLGHNPALSAMIGNDKYGDLYADGIKKSGIYLIRTQRVLPQQIQINVQVDGKRAGSICLNNDSRGDTDPQRIDITINKASDFKDFVDSHTNTLKYALIGGAPDGENQYISRGNFGLEIIFCGGYGIRVGAEPKDKLQGDGLLFLLRADDIKPNEGELFLIEKCVLEGVKYDKKLKNLARGEGAAKYTNDPTEAIKLYEKLLKSEWATEKSIINQDLVWVPTFGKSGALLVKGKDIRYQLTVKDMEKRAAKVGGSNQGCGNGAWAGYIDYYLRNGFNPEGLLKALGGGGMASNLWSGNMGGTAGQMRYYRRLANVKNMA
jgi:hypothetical protein